MSRLFDTVISVTGERGDDPRLSISLVACEMDGSFDESFSDSATSTTRRAVTLIVKAVDLAGGVPRVGDAVETADGRKFAVVKVQPFYGREFVLDCRGLS